MHVARPAGARASGAAAPRLQAGAPPGASGRRRTGQVVRARRLRSAGGIVDLSVHFLYMH